MDDIRERYRIGHKKAEAFLAKVGGSAVQYRGICIDSIGFAQDPGKTWQQHPVYTNTVIDHNKNLTYNLYRPNLRTKAGRELAAEMRQPYLPNEEGMLMDMFTKTVGNLYRPGKVRSPSGKTILSTTHYQGVYPELVDGVKEITEREYHLIMAEEPV